MSMGEKRNWHKTEIGGAVVDGRYGFSAIKLDPSINHEIRVVVDGNDVGYYNQDDLREALEQASGNGADGTAAALARLSRWIDESSDNAARDREALTWGRLAKVSEECGEVIEAFIGATAQNPRKGRTHSGLDVCKELLDVAVTALAAYEHMTNHGGRSINALAQHTEALIERAGLAEHGTEQP